MRLCECLSLNQSHVKSKHLVANFVPHYHLHGQHEWFVSRPLSSNRRDLESDV